MTTFENSLHADFAARWRALGAVYWREWTIFMRYPSWVVSMFVWPLIMPAAYILSAHALAGPDGSGLMHGVLLLSFLVISFVEFMLFFGAHFNGNPLLVGLVLLAAMPSIYGLGFAFASLVMTAKEANAFVFLVRGLVMIFCGITYPISVLPGWMQSLAAWLPQTYVIHGLRSAALTGAGLPALWPDLLPLIGFGAFWLAAGYVAFRWMEARSRRTGSLGQY